jgi:hypothetical protein
MLLCSFLWLTHIHNTTQTLTGQLENIISSSKKHTEEEEEEWEIEEEDETVATESDKAPVAVRWVSSPHGLGFVLSNANSTTKTAVPAQRATVAAKPPPADSADDDEDEFESDSGA